MTHSGVKSPAEHVRVFCNRTFAHAGGALARLRPCCSTRRRHRSNWMDWSRLGGLRVSATDIRKLRVQALEGLGRSVIGAQPEHQPTTMLDQ